MIKVFYHGYGYVGKNDEIWGVSRGKGIEGSFREYHHYFAIDSKIKNVLTHFGDIRIDYLNFIDDDLPSGVTKDIAQNFVFIFSAGVISSLPCFFILKKGIYEYKDNSNRLILFDDTPPATVPSEETPPISKYQERDNDFKAWLESEIPPLDRMTKAQIHDRLIARNGQLWRSGFKDWWEQQDIYKASRGRKKNLHPT